MGEFTKVATRGEVPDGGLMGVEAKGRRICLAGVGGEVYAFEDKCSHRDFPLSAGEFDPDDRTITCEWHGAIFDVESGAALGLPATRPIVTFPCKVEGDDVLVDVG